MTPPRPALDRADCSSWGPGRRFVLCCRRPYPMHVASHTPSTKDLGLVSAEDANSWSPTILLTAMNLLSSEELHARPVWISVWTVASGAGTRRFARPRPQPPKAAINAPDHLAKVGGWDLHFPSRDPSGDLSCEHRLRFGPTALTLGFPVP